jgi:ribosomal protein L44E
MSLPKIDVPEYTTELPSTGEVVKFRPFLVREQKQLLIAQGGDFNQQTRAVETIVRDCTFEKVNPAHYPAYDIEYLFLQIRARSVGENIDLVLTCGECGNKQETQLDITNVKVQKNEAHTFNIDLGPDLYLTMRDPDLVQISNFRDVENLNSEDIIKMVANCIQTIWKNSESYDVRDYPEADLIEFVENLSPQHFAKIEEFFTTMPKLRHDLEFKCTKCEAENIAALEGLQSFFV